MGVVPQLAEVQETCQHLHRHPNGEYGGDHHSPAVHMYEQPRGLDFQTRNWAKAAMMMMMMMMMMNEDDDDNDVDDNDDDDDDE